MSTVFFKTEEKYPYSIIMYISIYVLWSKLIYFLLPYVITRNNIRITHDYMCII